MVIVIKKNHSLILLRISGPFTRIYLLFFIASKCVKILFKAFIGTCIPFQTSVYWYVIQSNMKHGLQWIISFQLRWCKIMHDDADMVVYMSDKQINVLQH